MVVEALTLGGSEGFTDWVLVPWFELVLLLPPLFCQVCKPGKGF